MEYFGLGCVGELEKVLKTCPTQQLFVITGKRSFQSEVIQSTFCPIISQYSYTRFSEFDNNPKERDIRRGIETFQSSGGTTIIAIGGGSAIDMAKLINFFAHQSVSPSEFFLEGKRTEPIKKGVPLVAIPTTAGTGSEATQFATFYLNQKKFSVDHSTLLPEVALLDPTLTMTLPKKVTAESGMDALTQAIESYWSIRSTAESKAFAKEAIILLESNIEGAVQRPSIQSRANMLRGAHLAGKAINITRTTAAHAISYPMTIHAGIPHGQAVGISLPHFLEYNYAVTNDDLLDPRGINYIRKTLEEIARFFKCSSVAAAKEKILKMMKKIDLKTNLVELGIKRTQWNIILKEGFNPERVNKNPRRLTSSHLKLLLEQMSAS